MFRSFFLCWCEMTNHSSTFSISQTLSWHWQKTPTSFENNLVLVETFKSKTLAVSRHYPAQPFCPVLVLAFALGNFLVARIFVWHHFLGVWLYSNYTICHRHLERVLCLILPSHLVKSVSSTSILHCKSFLQECISKRGLLHYSEGSVFILR